MSGLDEALASLEATLAQKAGELRQLEASIPAARIAHGITRKLAESTQRHLLEVIAGDLGSGALKKRWEASLAVARASGLSDDEAPIGALSDVLATLARESGAHLMRVADGQAERMGHLEGTAESLQGVVASLETLHRLFLPTEAPKSPLTVEVTVEQDPPPAPADIEAQP